VRGLFSATQIARQMGVQLKSAEVHQVLADLEAAVSAH
jgi:hypothetical protein